MDKIVKIMGFATDVKTQIVNIDKVFDEAKFENDFKLFTLINGVFDKNIYANIKTHAELIKTVIICLFSMLIMKRLCITLPTL